VGATTGSDPNWLYYYRARYYDPHQGRFISEDPIGFDGGVNFYGYVSANPVNLFDPFGHESLCVTKWILVTAYCDKGPGSDWPYYKPRKKGEEPGSVGPGTCAVANTTPLPYPYGANVTVFGPNDSVDYQGEVHDTGAGWDCKHRCVKPQDWLDIWLPCKEAKQWGRQWRLVRICYDVCSKCGN
jgi:RHS repeat-associated protein